MLNDRIVTTIIDEDKCTGCGCCIPVCPKETITLAHGKARITGHESLNCGHCAAACPEEAITVGALDPSLVRFKTFATLDRWLPHGEFDTGALVNLMQSRRSCRNYKDMMVDPDILEDLIRIGVTAPSGSNSQRWSFTILPDRQSVLALGKRVGKFFEKINRFAEKRWLRSLLKLINRPALAEYYETRYKTVKEGFALWEKQAKDLLFHGATAVIIVGSRNDASCPSEDALLATQNIQLGAHAIGLGTCLIGYVIEAMKRDPDINRFVGIPEDETPYAVIALGWPRETYKKVAGRKHMCVRYAQFD